MTTIPSVSPGPDPATAPRHPTPTGRHADEALAAIRKAMPQLLADLTSRLDRADFPLLRFGEPSGVVRLTETETGPLDQWFFIGDIHGDFFALHTLLRQAEETCPDCRVLFLGDMVDRGDLPFECLFLLLEWGLRHPGRLAWIAGNHDLAFSMDDSGRFHSAVQPAELLAVLNAPDLFSGYRRALGQFLITLAGRLPRALLFPDGLLATHGGFPLRDLHPDGKAAPDEAAFRAWLNTEACLRDFTWTRIHRAPRKIPDRYSTGAQYGYTDFEAFCALQPDWFPVRRMITGHEHPVAGFTQHGTYRVNPVVTLVGFGFDELKPLPQAYQDYRDHLYLGRGVAGEVPAIIPVAVNRGELEMLYPALVPPAPAAPASEAASDAPSAGPETAALSEAGSEGLSLLPLPPATEPAES